MAVKAPAASCCACADSDLSRVISTFLVPFREARSLIFGQSSLSSDASGGSNLVFSCLRRKILTDNDLAKIDMLISA